MNRILPFLQPPANGHATAKPDDLAAGVPRTTRNGLRAYRVTLDLMRDAEAMLCKDLAADNRVAAVLRHDGLKYAVVHVEPSVDGERQALCYELVPRGQMRTESPVLVDTGYTVKLGDREYALGTPIVLFHPVV